jgi:plastocyanin
MLKRTTRMVKGALLLTGMMFMASEAFCGGVITGNIVSDLHRNRENVAVYLKGGKEQPIPRKVIVEQHHMTFIPKVTVIPTGSTVTFTNNDKIYHNVFSVSEPKKFNIDTTDPGDPKSVTFDKTGVVSLLCNVHHEMQAYLIITDSNYSAVSNAAGAFTINDVPAGTYEVVAWSDSAKAAGVTTVTVTDGTTTHVDVKLGD